MKAITYDALKFWFDEVGYTPADPWSVDVHKALLEQRKDIDGNPMPTLVLLAGGQQGGKSYLGGHHIFATHLFGKIFWIVGDTYEDTRHEFEYCTQAAIQAGVMNPDNVSFPNSPTQCKAYFNNGAVVKTLSSNDATRLAGESPDGILMVEAARQSEYAFRTLWTRAHHQTAWFLVSSTFELYKGRWYPDLWRTLQGENEYMGKSFSLPSYANLTRYPLGAEDPKVLAAKKTLTEQEFAERFLGVPRPTVGVVFPEFRRSTHVKNKAEYDPMYPIRLWVDPGYSPSSYAVLFVQIINDQVRVFKEIYEQHLVNDQIVDMVKNDPLYSKIERIVIDVAAGAHAGAQEPALEAWRRGLANRNIPIMSRYVKVHHGIQRTHDRLRMNPIAGEPYMIFHPRCESTIAEFEEGYKYPVRKSGSILDSNLPIDAQNHSAKALAYGIIDAYGYADGELVTATRPTRRRMAYDRR